MAKNLDKTKYWEKMGISPKNRPFLLKTALKSHVLKSIFSFIFWARTFKFGLYHLWRI